MNTELVIKKIKTSKPKNTEQKCGEEICGGDG